MATNTYTINLSISEMVEQIEELKSLSSVSEDFHGQVMSYLGEMGNDIIFGKPVTTLLADGAGEIVFAPKLGCKFERLVSTLRTSQAVISV